MAATSASIAARGAVGLRTEASFASGGGIDNWQVVESFKFTPTNVYAYNDRIRGTPEQSGGKFMHRHVAGEVVFPVSPSNPKQWWVCGIGGTGPYTPQIPLSSLMIEAQEGDVDTVLTSGDMVSSIEFMSRQGEHLKCTVRLECKDLGPRSASAVSFVSGDEPYYHSECQFTLDGVVNNQVTEFMVKKENHLVVDLFANNTTRRNILATKALITGTIMILFENTTFRDRFLNRLPSAITAVYTRGANSFTISLPNVNYDVTDRPVTKQAGDYIIENLNFTAWVADPTNSNSLSITVV